jgi:hypothetical protein
LISLPIVIISVWQLLSLRLAILISYGIGNILRAQRKLSNLLKSHGVILPVSVIFKYCSRILITDGNQRNDLFLRDTKCLLRKHLINAKEFLELSKKLQKGGVLIRKSIGYFLGQQLYLSWHKVCFIGEWMIMS